MQKQKLHYALCANLKDSITHRVYKLQFIGLTRMNINEKINGIINFFVNYSLMFILIRSINYSLSAIHFQTRNGLTDNVCSLQTYLLTRYLSTCELVNSSTQEIINSCRDNP